jgi:DNA-binding transcriptional MocR family regulator
MRYKKLAAQIAGLIRCGHLVPGMRLPSVRQATKSYGASAGTVFQAYYLLERDGLIEARPRSGYFVVPGACQTLLGSSIVRPTCVPLTADSDDLVFRVLDSIENPDIVPLGSALPSSDSFPLNRLDRALASVMRKTRSGATRIELHFGDESLRRQIVRRYLDAGIAVPIDEVVVTNGALEALTLCLQTVTSPGDAVAIQAPAFYATLQILDRLRLKAIEIPIDPTEGLDLSALADALQRHPIRACLFMTSFQNPTGVTMSDAAKNALVTLLAAHDVPLIEDDVYAELYFGASRPRPSKTFDRKGLVLHCSSFSKSLAPGYRVGWVAAGRFTQQVARAKWMTNISTFVPSQLAIADILQGRGYNRHLHQLRRNLAVQQDKMVEAVERFFPSGTRVARPQGGYFLWLELPPQADALRLFELSLEQGIGIAPGPIFSATRGFRNCVRLNYGHPWTCEFERSVEAVGTLARSL